MRRRPSPLVLTLLALAPGAGRAQEAPISPEITPMIHEAAQGWFERAQVAERERRTLEAEGLYARALEADPGLLAAHLGYARMLDARGHRAEAAQVLARAPRRAWSGEREALEFARAQQALGQTDEALAALREHGQSPEATRLLVEMASQAGRFPEALAAARRLAESAALAADEARQARLLVRALTRLVAEADAVRAPHTSTGFRRVLMQE